MSLAQLRDVGFELLGTSIVAVAFVPWIIEVIWQLRFQARFIAALPEAFRTKLPRHPRSPWLAFLARPRFHLALWRYARRDLPGDSDEILRMKRAFRASLRRELFWVLGAGCVVTILLAGGWRPAGL